MTEHWTQVLVKMIQCSAELYKFYSENEDFPSLASRIGPSPKLTTNLCCLVCRSVLERN